MLQLKQCGVKSGQVHCFQVENRQKHCQQGLHVAHEKPTALESEGNHQHLFSFRMHRIINRRGTWNGVGAVERAEREDKPTESENTGAARFRQGARVIHERQEGKSSSSI